MEPPFPDHIDLVDVVVRRFTPDDVPALARAMSRNYEHLHPWMSWATPEGVTAAAARGFVDDSIAQAAAGSDFVYGIFAKPDDEDATTVLGTCGLHDRIAPGALEMGYWLDIDATGRGLMTKAAGRLTELALALPKVTRVEIHCDEANTASAAVPRRLGYTLLGIRPAARPGGTADTGRQMVWAYP